MIIPTTTTIASESSYSSTSEDSSSGSEPPPCGSGTGILNIDSSPVIVDETVFKRERNSKQRTGVGKSKEKQRTQPPVDARIDTEVPGTKRKSTTTKATPMPAATAVPSPPCKKRLRRTSVKLAEKHADSKHPLLSMIATEQWFGKTVHIAVGPLEGRTGLVQKWGNGWVSVRVKGVGLHNRRSLELYISDDELKEGNAMDVEVNQSVEIIKKSLSRSVSREAVSPSPSSDSSLKSLCSGSKTLSKEHADFQPRVEQTLVSPLFCRQGKNRKISMAIENTSLDDVVFLPETPRPSCVDPRPRETPKVTPFNDSSAVKASQHTLSLLTSDSTMHLQLPDASPSVKNLTKTVSGRHCGMVFRPSMGERTRGRTASYCEEEDTIASVSFTTSDVDHLL